MAISRLSETTLQTGFQKFNTLWDGRSGVGAFETLGSWRAIDNSVQSVTFSNIPATYQNLQIRGLTIGTSGNQDILMYFNGVTGTNYTWHEFRGSGNGSSGSYNATTGVGFMYVASNSTDDTFPTPFIVDVSDYATSKFKPIKSISGTSRSSTTGTLSQFSGIYAQSTAVTSVTLYLTGAYYFFTGSTISLYGVK